MPPGTETDVNGDNRADTVVGDPYATVAWQAGAGRLIVLYGDNDGLVGEGLRDVLWQGEAEVFGTPEAGDHFVSVLGMADIDCDSYTDVVVGAPGQDIGAAANAGGVMLVQDVYASEDMVGISLDQNAAGVPGVSEAGDRCGHSVDTIRVGGASRIATSRMSTPARQRRGRRDGAGLPHQQPRLRDLLGAGHCGRPGRRRCRRQVWGEPCHRGRGRRTRPAGRGAR